MEVRLYNVRVTLSTQIHCVARTQRCLVSGQMADMITTVVVRLR